MAIFSDNWHPYISFYGYVNKRGEKVIESKYSYADNFSEGLALVMTDDDFCGFINLSGQEILPITGAFRTFSEGLALEYTWESIDKHKYSNESIYIVDEHGGYEKSRFFINMNGEKTIEVEKYDEVESFSNGLAKISVDSKIGYIDQVGNEIVKPRYDRSEFNKSGTFSEGLAVVQQNNRWGYITNNGDEIIPLLYFNAGKFSNGLARVEYCNKKTINYCICSGYFDSKGIEYWED
ncbi:WG repeat-containing protein [Spirosoma spitsbergense]|uniref:WG repeat-containing protein n=1 Tax=Spirosoma spitsbergense TaxID=431554 RepID=UPI00037B6C48|nr:WG repeat-containing protein [Spirosoma spitsbergense]